VFELLVLFLCFSGLLYLFRGTVFSLVFGFILLGNGVNLVIFGLSRPKLNAFPFYAIDGSVAKSVADPVAQALVLTAIVISFSLFFYMIAVTIKLAKTYKVATFEDLNDEGFGEKDE